ncbi:Peroxisomal membrane protein PEX17 [Cytospora mali]|uniref:Peroxisomal membrane protein PEX17 n=1 Tax=Cytospora mali TaxID=578113 RepID=A0A194VE44_CYTMA|nr:Peroxisomal membrane protein PEX17 [Valsa mali var. pyri (nom. inval.)]
MPADHLLNRVLGLYQTVHDNTQTERIFGTTLTLLTELTNPLNLSLLTSQFLTAPAIWHRRHEADPLRTTCLRVLGVYNTAAIHVRRNELEDAEKKHAGITATPHAGGGLKSEAWARAVVKGADERSSRWQHLLVLAGIMMGFEGHERQGLSGGMKRTLEQAVVTAANLALQSLSREPPIAATAVVLALNYAFPLMSDAARALVDSDALLPIAIHAMVGDSAFEGGMFLGPIDLDIGQAEQRFDWPETSLSFAAIRQLASKPLVETAGPLSKLVAFAIENAKDYRLILQAQDELRTFTARLLEQWQHVRLSEIDISDDAMRLSEGTIQVTSPVLWRLLTNILFAVVAILRSVTARCLLDPHLRNDAMAPVVASKTLHIYRNLYFISSRGNDSFQVYMFSYMTSIDIVARYSGPSVTFLKETLPPNTGSPPSHALHRTLDLFYLNTAEHLPLNISPEACENLIVQPATVYLSQSAPPSNRMVALFEAAHSAVLSVLSCPQNGSIAIKMAPYYAETLLASFPSHISHRQFRLAFRTLMQILSPPFPASASNPELAETLLEMVRLRIPTAGQSYLPAAPDQDHMAQSPMSEQSALVLTLIDSLPFLHLPIVEDWMTIVAVSLHEIPDMAMREVAKERFWEILGSGEMDVERGAIGVAWWGTKGGRELMTFGPAQCQGREPLLMSGAIVDEKVASRL